MLTPEMIANKTFRRTLLGYDLEQVDDYLDEIILYLQQLERERKEMNDTIEYLAAEVRRLSPDKGVHEEPAEDVALPVSPHVLMGHEEKSEEKTVEKQEEKHA